MDSAPPTIQFDKIKQTINPDKNFLRNFQLSSNKKNKYKISIFNKDDKLKITALNLDSSDIKNNEYEKEILISELKNNKYLSLCETTIDMLDELFNLIDTKKYFLTEEDCELILHIEVPMKVIKEITFNLVKKEQDINGIINDLIEENKELKSKIEILSLQNRDLKDDIDYLKDKNLEGKMNELYNKFKDKVNDLELKINEQKLAERKEKNELISQVNILTKKILTLEKELETEKNNNKKFQEKINNQLKTSVTPVNTNTPSKNNEMNNNPPFHTSKSENLPELIFETFFGGILGLPELGKKGRSKFHNHILVYSSYDMKDQGYANGSYLCDHCKQEFSRKVNNFHCKPCHFDLCDRCFKISQY